MIRKKIYSLLVFSSLLMSPVYATSTGIIDLDEEQPSKSITPFTFALRPTVRCAIQGLPGLVMDAAAQARFSTMSENEFYDDKDPGSSMITRLVNFYKFGYYFTTVKAKGVEYYTQLSPMGLDEKGQVDQQKKLLKLIKIHSSKKLKFSDNSAATSLALEIAKEARSVSTRLITELPPIDFKTTLIRTMGITTRSLKAQPVDKTHHQSEFVEPISGRLFQFNLKTDYSIETASGAKTIYPYDLTNETLDWGVDFVRHDSNKFTYSIFFNGDGEKAAVGSITLLKM